MPTTTRPEVWPTDTPLVIYVVPATDPIRYAALMDHVTRNVEVDLGWEQGKIETLGLIATDPTQIIEAFYLMDELGIDPRSVTAVIMFGDTAEALPFVKPIPIECGIGFVSLPRAGIVLPIMRMPYLGMWWLEPVHQSYAEVSYAEMVREGRVRCDEGDQAVTISPTSMWN
jgi:hypothetical protein